MSENLRMIRFAVIVCLGCSLLVSTAAILLRDRQEANLKLDIRKNILKSVGLFQLELTPDEVNSTYDERMRGIVVTKSGDVVEGKTPGDLDPDVDFELLPLFQCLEDGDVTAYTFPIEGKGLWSTMYGYFALERDLDTVKGITFYKHGETPGLGGEIEKPWFQESFVGKRILNRQGEIASVTVAKGKATDRHAGELEHYVDGISGATITSRGVTDMLDKTLRDYEPYFRKIRGPGGAVS